MNVDYPGQILKWLSKFCRPRSGPGVQVTWYPASRDWEVQWTFEGIHYVVREDSLHAALDGTVEAASANQPLLGERFLAHMATLKH